MNLPVRSSVALAILIVTIGCQATASPSTQPSPSDPVTATPAAAASVASLSTPSPAATAAEPRYATTNFRIPLSVVVAEGLPSTPTADTPGLLTWTATSEPNNRIRFLSPAEVYPPGAKTPVPPPADFLAYIKGQADRGGILTDMSATTVDGLPATLLTANASRPLDGSLGCPTKEGDPECFGLQPGRTLRMAVVDVHGQPLLIWARTDSQAPDDAFLVSFERMLGTVIFR
ncbi:MAG: hypothetical protein ABIV26_04355 [Candidatus Limnocylindrales bacterium]